MTRSIDDRMHDQRESCYRICSGLWIRRPSLPYLLTIMTIVSAAVYAFWRDVSASQQRIVVIETHQVSIDSAVVSLRADVLELKKEINFGQVEVVKELQALRADLQLKKPKR